MRMAELSRESGVPVATVKFYLREGLLPAGERTGRNQARYGDQHVRRLRLVRALLDIGGLSLAQVADIVAAMDSDESGPHKVFGAAQATVTLPGLSRDDESEQAVWARQRVNELIEQHGWQIGEESSSADALARLLITMSELGQEQMLEQLDARADAMQDVAKLDVDLVDAQPDLDSMVGVVVVGTLIGGAVMAALRGLAQEDQSARRYGVPEQGNLRSD